MSNNLADKVTFAETLVPVATADGVLIAANPNRTYLLITNPSANTIYITTLGTAILAGGIPIAPNGSYERSGPSVPKNAFRAIAATGAVNVTVIEA